MYGPYGNLNLTLQMFKKNKKFGNNWRNLNIDSIT